MARKFSVKQRNTGSRKPKPLIILVAEGRNVTETLYFRQFQRQHAAYNIKVLTPGSITDPEGMLKKIEGFWHKNEMDQDKGDLGFIVLDLDCDEEKANLIKKLEAGSKIAQFIVSNPCFEIWYILHFKYTTHVYASGAEVIRDLKNYINNYEKNRDVSGALSDKMETAIENAKRLEGYFEELGYKWPSVEGNPRTDVPLIIKSIRELGGDEIE